MIKRLAEFVSTFGYSGLSPIAPGTVGSIVALGLISPLIWFPSILWCLVAFTFVTMLGFILIPFYLEGKVDDLQEIVIDEASGLYLSILIAMLSGRLFAITPNWYVIFALCFVLFRLFDITKPSIVGYFDRNFKGSIGIMLDDIVAGVIAGLIVATILIIYKYIIL